MSENSKIEWTDHTFNPWIGCTKVSPGCDHCYAEVSSPSRALGVRWGAGQPRRLTSESNWKEPLRWNARHEREMAEWVKVAAGIGGRDEAIKRGIHPPRRQRVFCASLADVFDNEVPPEWRRDLFALIAATPNLDWLLLTKRIGNAVRMLPPDWGDGYPNAWLGISVVNQEEADRDIPKLLCVPATVRFLSMEPLLGPVDLGWYLRANVWVDGRPVRGGDYGHGAKLDWAIVGGESGPHARPMHPDWARSLRDQCAAAGVPFFFKQWGESIAGELAPNPDYPGDKGAWRLDQSGRRWHDPFEASKPHSEWEPVVFMKVGKKAAGRLLDGVVHNEFPKVAL